MSRVDSKAQQFDAWLALTGQVPSPEGSVRLPMLSGSMLPAIPVGHILVIEICTHAACRMGDVVVFVEGEHLVAHRLLTKGFWPWLLEKGDINPTGHWLHQGRIRGRVTGVVSAAGDDEPTSPFDRETAAASRCQHWRNLLLAGPRRIRDYLAGAPKGQP